ncbi:hypothetical protein L2Y90_32120 (plasmid) [Burkholderia pyrrocinia]|uniref:hypothetical protein n=1 Tax=Burkholderia pyrrocinia TaxID=60550 RepID=UPI00215A89FC|nr:hypothetical protein [Burkholderia pyrrocinia]UVE70468.1 hypothetical protein L2Y90_32120 [Burkholderia pyrrocinia]
MKSAVCCERILRQERDIVARRLRHLQELTAVFPHHPAVDRIDASGDEAVTMRATGRTSCCAKCVPQTCRRLVKKRPRQVA